jgi:hypothetical protein
MNNREIMRELMAHPNVHVLVVLSRVGKMAHNVYFDPTAYHQMVKSF